MHEFKRVFGNKKVISAFLILFAVNLLYYVYSCYSNSYSPKEYREVYANLLKQYGEGDFSLALENMDKDIEIYNQAELLLYIKDKYPEEYPLALESNKEYYPDNYEDIEKLSQEKSQGELRATIEALNNIKEQLYYLSSYPELLSSIKAQGEQMTSVSIFGNRNSFAFRNIQKTVKDYAALDGAILTLGSDMAINSFYQGKITDYLVLIFLLIIALTFIEERNKGLWSIIRLGSEGRMSLGVKRVMIMLIASLLSSLLLFGSKLIAAFVIYGGTEGLDRLIQSIPLFKEFWIPLSVAQFILIYLAIKVLASFLVGMGFWILLSAFSHFNVAVASLSVFLGIEYVFYSLIKDNSIFVLLKYINIFSYVEQSQFFTHYMNLNIFKYPINSSLLLIALAPILILLLIYAALKIQCSKYPVGSQSYLSSKLDTAARRINSAIKSRSVFINELYKVMFIQKGSIIIFIAALVMVKVFSPGMGITDMQDRAYEMYYKSLSGPVTEDTFKEIDSLLREAEEQIEALKKSIEQQGGDMGFDFMLTTLNEKADNIRSIEVYAKEIKEREEREGIKAYIIPQVPYKGFLEVSTSRASNNLLALLAITFISLISAGIIPFERQRGINQLLRSAYGGRNTLWKNKILCGAIVALFIWGITTWWQLYSVIDKLGALESLSAPVQNLIFLSSFPLRISILQYLMLFFAIRLFMMLAVLFIVMLLSTFAKRIEHAIVISMAIVVLPTAISAIGAVDLGLLSSIKAVSLVEVISNPSWGSLAVLLLMAILGLLALLLCRYRIVSSKL